VGLIANQDDEGEVTQIEVWHKDQLNRYYKDFDRFGIKADF